MPEGQCGLWGQAILSVDIRGKVIGWKYSKGFIIAARKREDGQVEVVLGEHGNTSISTRIMSICRTLIGQT